MNKNEQKRTDAENTNHCKIFSDAEPILNEGNRERRGAVKANRTAADWLSLPTPEDVENP